MGRTTNKHHVSTLPLTVIIFVAIILSLSISTITYAASYSIIYDDNVASNMPTDVSDKTFSNTTTTSSSTPARPGYDYLGWCSVIPTNLNGTDICTGGTQYSSSDSISINQTGTTNDFHLYAMWKKNTISCPAGYICYSPNADDVQGTMNAIDVYPGDTTSKIGYQLTTNSTAVTLIAHNFKRTNYGFLGWSTSPRPTIGTDTIYGPMEDITTPSDIENNGLALYAVWIPSAGDIQNWTGCNNMNQGDVTALSDKRDNNTYAVAKLTNTSCWMIENLRLDQNAVNIATESQGRGGSFTTLANSEDADFTISTTANSLYNTNNITGNNQEYRFPRYNRNNTNIGGTNSEGTTLTTSHNLSGNSMQWYGYGNDDNWAATVANTTDFTNNNDSTTTSICPKGWHLPKGGDKFNESNNEYWNLIVTNINNGTKPVNYNDTDNSYYTDDNGDGPVSSLIRKYPYKFILSGYWNNTQAYNRGSGGNYRTATNNSGTNSYYMAFGKTDVRPGTYSHLKYYGNTIRCIADS